MRYAAVQTLALLFVLHAASACDASYHVRGRVALENGDPAAAVAVRAWWGERCGADAAAFFSTYSRNDGSFDEGFMGPRALGPLAVEFFKWEYEKQCILATPAHCGEDSHFAACYLATAVLRPRQR